VASGPYPGTFAAHGEWKYRFGYFNFYNVGESFTISSGKRTFHGRISGSGSYDPGCPSFLANNLTFEIKGRNWTGISRAAISKESFSESFQ
jgi:hypothetical protein